MAAIRNFFSILLAIIMAAVTGVQPPLLEPLAENKALCPISGEALAKPYEAGKLYYLDLAAYLDSRQGIRTADYYDMALIMGVLQGLVNRDGAHFYIRFTSANNADEVWFKRLTSDSYWTGTLGREPQFLAGKEVVTLSSPVDALYLFRDFYKGFIAWDGDVPATSNAALTACGCDSLLPLRYSEKGDSLYRNLAGADNGALFNFKGNWEQKKVFIDLHGKFVKCARYVYGTDQTIKSTGSRKCDAVLWSVYNYLEAGKTNPHLMAYHIDAYYPAKTADGETDYDMGHIKATAFLLNNDYYIANKAFFFDLDTMKYETPSDDPDQTGRIILLNGSLDYQTLERVLKAQNNRAAAFDYKPITCGGFTAWHIKYTNFLNIDGADKLSDPVKVEWQTVRELSYFNVMLDADAPGLVAMSDASVFMHYPKQASYTQKGENAHGFAEEPKDENCNYVLIYMGDYDSAAWLNSQTLANWDNAERGTLPLAWSFAPGLYDRAPQVIDNLYATATQNDYFAAGDNGVGYLNPEALASAENFGTLGQWSAYNAGQFKRFDMDIQGFLIFDRDAVTLGGKLFRTKVLQAYSSFAPKGLMTNNAGGMKNVNSMPIVQTADCGEAAHLMALLDKNPRQNGSRFTAARVILKSPETVNNWVEEINAASPDYRLRIVDPYTFMKLYSAANGSD